MSAHETAIAWGVRCTVEILIPGPLTLRLTGRYYPADYEAHDGDFFDYDTAAIGWRARADGSTTGFLWLPIADLENFADTRYREWLDEAAEKAREDLGL